jgi:hypothetical protein
MDIIGDKGFQSAPFVNRVVSRIVAKTRQVDQHSQRTRKSEDCGREQVMAEGGMGESSGAVSQPPGASAAAALRKVFSSYASPDAEDANSGLSVSREPWRVLLDGAVITSGKHEMGKVLIAGACGIVLSGICLILGCSPGQEAKPSVVDEPVSKQAPQLPVNEQSTRTASWFDRSPIAVAPALLHCGCLDAYSRNAQSGVWERLANGDHRQQAGTKIRYTSQCPSVIQLFAVRDTVPDALRVPMMRAAAGRSYALESLNAGESVVFDPYQNGPAMVAFMPANCPAEFARPVPLACVSDARLTPALSPGGPPMVCAAQGPANTACSCNGRQGINFLGDVAPYP